MGDDLSREDLSLFSTAMANKRTLHSSLRTSISLVALALAAIKFFDRRYTLLAVVCTVVAIAVAVVALREYAHFESSLERLKEQRDQRKKEEEEAQVARQVTGVDVGAAW